MQNEIDLGRIFRIALMQSKFIIFFTLFFTFLSILYVNFSSKIYKINSSIQVFQAQSSFSSGTEFDIILGSSNTLDVNNLISLYKSRSNLMNVINTLDLNIDVENLSDDEFIEFLDFEVKYIFGESTKTFYIEPQESFIRLLDEDKSLIAELKNKERYKSDKISLEVNYKLNENKIYKVTHYNPEDIFKFYRNKVILNSSIDGNSFWRNNGIIQVSMNAEDIELGKKFISYANESFINSNIEVEKEKASSAIEFIDQQINSIQSILEINKRNLQSFQESNTSLNVDLEIQSVLEQISSIESKISSLDIEIAKIENTYTENNPLYLSLINQRNVLTNQKDIVEKQIRGLPIAQQEYIDLFRDLEISQALYSDLVNKRLSFSILEASTLGNLRVLDEPFVDFLVSPRSSNIFITFILSFLFSILFAIWRGLNFTPISNPAEIADNGIDLPILAVTPLEEEGSKDKEITERMNQSIESLIVNINSLISQKDIKDKVVLITSATPFNGKSYISRTLAKSLSSVGRVLLIDNDLKRGDQHKVLGSQPLTFAEFTQINDQNINNYKVSDNFYFIPKIKSLSSSFQFLYSAEYKNKIEEFNEIFDYIIFDTAPALSVSDTAILMSLSSIKLVVLRHQLSKINEIRQLKNISDQIGADFDGCVYNAYSRPQGFYGYYGLYGNYSYQYYADKYLYEAYDYDPS